MSMDTGTLTALGPRTHEWLFVSEHSSLLPEAILATLTYHDLLSIPLTAVEVWRFLIRPRGSAFPLPSLPAVERKLQSLVRAGTLSTRSGFYAFPGKEHCIVERRERHALAQRKWRRLRRVSWWLQAVPFLRMIAGSGSLAREVVRERSDLDVLLVAQSGRIWTVRFLVTVLLDLFRIRRRPTGPTKDLVCLNHYLTLDGLHLPYQSLYTALECARLVPLIGEGVCRAFRDANRAWMEQFLVRVLPDVAPHQKRVAGSPLLRSIQRCGEWLLGGWLGDVVERSLGALQMRRIAPGDKAHTPGRVVASAVRLEFHPHSREAPLLAEFNLRMALHGLQAFGEQRDSGLSV